MLEGRVAIVSGAGRGIGRGIAKLMAAKGAKVVVNDLGGSFVGQGKDKSPAEEVVAEIKADGGKAVPNYDSVSAFEGTTNIVNQALKEFGRLDIIVNTAGILRDKMLHKMDPDDWKAIMDVHLGGHYNLSRAAINIFREQDYGRIINFSSTSGITGNIGQTNYGAAKLGIVGFTRNLALECASKNITVNCISPFAWTRMVASIPVNDPEVEAAMEAMKLLKPEYIAPVVVYLASEDAKGVNGQIFGVRGAEVMIFSVMRPMRSVHHNGGWTPEDVRDSAIKALAPHFSRLMRTEDEFPYDPLV